ncbi:MAG: hypothetical protein QOJ89_857 [bacterium]
MSAPDWAGPRSVLELWHPTGAPTRRLSLGAAAAAPVRDGDDRTEPVDFAIVAPGGAELSGVWLDQAIADAGARLEPDGIVCVVVPRRWRQTGVRLIRRAGMQPRGALLTAPWPDCSHAVSLDAAALRGGGGRLLGLRDSSAACVAALSRAGAGRAIVALAMPACALIATRRHGRDPLSWLAALDGAGGACRATATRGVREDARVAVVLRYAPASRSPDLVAKVALDAGGRERIERERAALASLGDGARRAGAAVPALVPARAAGPGLLATSALAGRPASGLLVRDPGRVDAILGALSSWLRGWTAATRTAGGAAEALERLLIAPAERVASAAPGAATARYAVALRQLAARLEGRALVLAAAHNDLTMANVLVTGDGTIGVVDWESADGASPPLADDWYACADGLARAGGLTHAQAVAQIARRRAPIAAQLATRLDERSSQLGLSADEQLLAFHACWLHHAGNELDRGIRGGAFDAVVRSVAETRLRWPAGEDHE